MRHVSENSEQYEQRVREMSRLEVAAELDEIAAVLAELEARTETLELEVAFECSP